MRWQLENHPELYDGGLDWEGTLWRADGPNLLVDLPVALRNYPTYAATGGRAAHDAMVAAGFPAGSERLWPFHYTYYWDLTQRIYREELDPSYDGATEAGTPFCPSGTPGCDTDYVYAQRPQAQAAVSKIALTGRLGKPMLTLHGTIDVLLPIATDSDVYAGMIDAAGAGQRHRYYRVEGGTHVDSLHAAHPDLVRPLLPCARTAFTALEAWVEKGTMPPASATLARPGSGDVVNECALAD